MSKTVDAVYEGGVLRPLEPVNLKEGEHVRIPFEREEPEDLVALAGSVYEGLSSQEIDEIERVAFGNRNLFEKDV